MGGGLKKYEIQKTFDQREQRSFAIIGKEIIMKAVDLIITYLKYIRFQTAGPVCVCVCMRERERERSKEGGGREIER